MRYALFVYDAPESLEPLSNHERQQVFEEFVAISALPEIIGHRLQPSHTAITLSIESGEVSTEVGPHADPRRELIGFYVLEADDVGRALDVAARIPTARLGGAIQVHPLVVEP